MEIYNLFILSYYESNQCVNKNAGQILIVLTVKVS